MNKKYKNFIFAVMLLLLSCMSEIAVAGKSSTSSVTGDPSIRWDVIGDNKEIKNNAYDCAVEERT